MSKADGQYIVVKFDQQLDGNITGRSPAFGTEDRQILNSILTKSSDYSASYPSTNAVDGSLTTYWRPATATNQWLLFQPVEALVLTVFKVYIGSTGYAPKNVLIEGSDDGVAFTSLHTALISNSATGWQTLNVSNTTAYNYYRFYITDGYGYHIRVYEVELYYTKTIGNERAFTVTGQEYDHTNGSLVAGDYQVKQVDPHPAEPNAILLTMESLKRFNNVVGNLTVGYDEELGVLGVGGVMVESFSESFLPTDLGPKPNPWHTESLTAEVQTSIVVTRVYHTSAYETEYITAQVQPGLTVTNTGGNPL